MRTLLVFLKYPAAGQVKTRLAESLGAKRAAELYRQWIDVVFSRVQSVRDDTRLVAFFGGAPAEAFAPWHDQADAWWPQPAGDLGARLEAGFARAQTSGEPAVAVGTDCLDLGATHVASAFDVLGQRDAVFGPAEDGGYYLVGTARHLPNFFEGIPWSTSSTLSAHQERCRNHGWTFGLLPTLADIDTLEDWLEYERRGNKP